jgi:hypothetical protein
MENEMERMKIEKALEFKSFGENLLQRLDKLESDITKVKIEKVILD